VVNRSRGLPKKQVKEPPDLLARGKICVQNGVEWSCGMLVDLSTLALLAVSAHGCHSLHTVKRPILKSSLMRQIVPLEYINTLLKRSIP